MDYTQTLDFLYSQLPIFQRQGGKAYKKDLTRTIALCDAIGNPHEELRFVHVAGTNGKGSVCHTLASIFKEAGYQTGLYTSPHLLNFRERIQVDGNFISKDFVCRFVASIRSAILEIEPSFFELTVVMAFQYFKELQVDIVVLETGMGGRLDSTNVVSPELSIITNIGLDHMAYLGNTLEAITTEKAGIIKPEKPIVIGDLSENLIDIVETKAKYQNAKMVRSNETEIDTRTTPWQFKLKKLNETCEINPALKTAYQKQNLAVVGTVFQLLAHDWQLKLEHLKTGMENVQQNFPLQGRWQEIQAEPKVILDVGHNADGISCIIKELAREQYRKLHIVFGMVDDKDPKILQLLPKEAEYYLTQPDIPRKLDIEKLQSYAEKAGLSIAHSAPQVSASLKYALEKSEKKDLILVMGSLFVVAEGLKYFKRLNTTNE